MFDSLDWQFARRDVIAIAQDRIGPAPESLKAQALDWIGVALEKWKLEQGSGDKTIEIEWYPGLLGLVPDGLPSLRLSEVGRGIVRRRVPISQVQPHQCAGARVKCPADLLIMLWSERYPPVEVIAEKLGLDLAVALLIERDGMTMAADSLAQAVRLLWQFQQIATGVYRDMLTTTKRRQADIAAKARAAKAERNGPAFARAEWSRMAAEIWRSDINKKRHTVASEIRANLAARQRDGKVRRVPAVATIEDAIKGVRESVVVDLARSFHRQQRR
jgi:hypothetical protein